MINQNIQFFIGKGGVGKSTVSALRALGAANSGTDTLLISLDPAHNQKDIFELNFSDKAIKVSENLHIIEPDIDLWVKKYLKDAEEKLQGNYHYHQAFSLKNYFKVLKYAPAVEEYAMLMAFSHYLEQFKSKQQVIVDMPPTALSLRFFALPGLSLKWLEQLIQLRLAIQEKKEIISKIKFGNKELETDKVLLQLNMLNKSYLDLYSIFNAPNSKIYVVANPENLSLNEAERIIKKMQDIELNISGIILNKTTNQMEISSKRLTFSQLEISRFKLSNSHLIGLESLNAYLNQFNID
ncbi:MAG: TRC40/GET3/ArsA family transport-energizing ATPase [Bacteroidales bacterium]|nr:TRC40/GET3/ArsA family transport-energizing ATPase [Bacteroidales bacterium]